MNLRDQLRANGASELAIAWRCEDELLASGAQGLPNALRADLERGGETSNGGGAGVGDQAPAQLPQRALVQAGQLGEVAEREPALVDQVVQRLGHVGMLPSSERIRKVPLDIVPESADDAPRESPDRCQLSTGSSDRGQQSAPERNETVSTTTLVPTLLQQLEAACAGAPLHNPATDAWVAERRAAYDAEQTRDLAGLSREQLEESVRFLFCQQQGGEHVDTDFGVDLLVDDEGEIVDAAVADVATFAELWGAPVTHARAAAIADEVRQRDRRDEHRESLERAVERAEEIRRERSRETYYLGNN